MSVRFQVTPAHYAPHGILEVEFGRDIGREQFVIPDPCLSRAMFIVHGRAAHNPRAITMEHIGQTRGSVIYKGFEVPTTVNDFGHFTLFPEDVYTVRGHQFYLGPDRLVTLRLIADE